MASLRRFFSALALGKARPQTETARWRLGFAVAMFYALGCACLALRQAFATPYSFADDAREHVFWMVRFLDPHLLPHDASADYFQALAPLGYAALFRVIAWGGLDPWLASKWIPSLLSFVAAGYFFAWAARFFRSPAGGTFAALLFIQCLWLNSDLSSATPRAFFYPLFAAFLYYHSRGSTAGVLIVIVLEALFFPPAALLSLGVLAWVILRWDNGIRLAPEARTYLLLAGATALTLLCFIPYLHQLEAVGPLVTYAEASRMAEFGQDGRVPVFLPTWWGYWIGGNAGLHSYPLNPPWYLLALLWPLLRWFPRVFPWLQKIPRGARPIPQLFAASLTLFALAHVFLFRLYLPNRYTQAFARVVLILLAGGVLCALFEAAWRWQLRLKTQRGRLVRLGLMAAMLALISFPLLVRGFPRSGYMVGTDPGLYQFFARQPAAIQIASLADEADNLPLLCRRSNIVGAECAVPFHPDYYLPLRQRGLEIARAQYSSNPAVVQGCVRDLKVDFWLLDRKAFTRKYWKKSRLLRQLRLIAPNEGLGESGGARPYLKHPPADSIVYRDSRFLVLDAHRLGPASLIRK